MFNGITIPEFIVPQNGMEARFIQDELRGQIRLKDDFTKLDFIAGVDVGYDIKRNLAHASVVIIEAKSLCLLENVQAFAPSRFPYIPGLLSFREIPAILAALALLKIKPDLLMVDGHGIAHPRRMGIASHLGIIMDMPSIGVGKSRLFGKFNPPGNNKGDSAPLMAGNEQIGVVLRSKNNVNPLFISPGHRISLETSASIVDRCLTNYRLPETTRLADKLSKLSKANKNLDLL